MESPSSPTSSEPAEEQFEASEQAVEILKGVPFHKIAPALADEVRTLFFDQIFAVNSFPPTQESQLRAETRVEERRREDGTRLLVIEVPSLDLLLWREWEGSNAIAVQFAEDAGVATVGSDSPPG